MEVEDWMNKHLLTEAGYKALKEELLYLREEKWKEVSEKVKASRSFCDFNEDPEHRFLVDELASLKKRINDLEYQIDHAEIVKDKNPQKVGIGSLVTVKDEGEEEEMQFKIVSSNESKVCENCISDQSPVGSGLMGQQINDQIEVKTPSGKMDFIIIGIQ